MPNIGLSHIHYAIMDSDPVGGVPVYQAPIRIVKAMQANINPNTSSETLFADDGPADTATTLGDIELELNMADLSLDEQADLLGHEVVGGILKKKGSDNPPWVAIGFKTLKSNGSYRYVWLQKGKFQPPEQNHETKGDTVNFQTPTIRGNFVKRDADQEWERMADEDHVDYVPSIGTNWFTDPGGVADTTPPTITLTDPLDTDVGVLITVAPVITFSEALALSTINSDNIFMVKVSDDSVVAGALTMNAARTEITFTPTVALDAATAYKMMITTLVSDVAGNKLATLNTFSFTTA